MSTVRVPRVYVATTHVVRRRPPSPVRPVDRSADRALLELVLGRPLVPGDPGGPAAGEEAS